LRTASVIVDDSTRNVDTRRPQGYRHDNHKTWKIPDWLKLPAVCGRRLQRGVLYCQNAKYCTSKRNFTDACNKSTSFPGPIFTQFSNTQEHHVQLTYMAFHSTEACFLCTDVHRTRSRWTDFCERILCGTGSKSDEKYDKNCEKFNLSS